jgi:hypothetical protein
MKKWCKSIIWTCTIWLRDYIEFTTIVRKNQRENLILYESEVAMEKTLCYNSFHPIRFVRKGDEHMTEGGLLIFLGLIVLLVAVVAIIASVASVVSAVAAVEDEDSED